MWNLRGFKNCASKYQDSACVIDEVIILKDLSKKNEFYREYNFAINLGSCRE